MATASAIATSTVLIVEKGAMLGLLHDHQSLADEEIDATDTRDVLLRTHR